MLQTLVKSRQLGHSEERLNKGHTVTTYFSIDSLEGAKEILTNASLESRKARSQLYFEQLSERGGLRMGLHDRGEGFVFANEPYPEGDQSFINEHLPFRVKAISILSKELMPGEVWDLSVSPNQWGLHLGEDTYVILNVGTLILHPGASIIVKGNVLSFLCQRLIKVPGKPTYQAENPYDIGILPTPQGYWPAHAPVLRIHGIHGEDGVSGDSGLHGTPLKVVSGMFGPVVTEATKSSIHGHDGDNGTAGTRGARGANGAICKLAEITINHIDSETPINIFAQAGPGGDGGDGGNGGHGGDGGDGGNGLNAIANLTAGSAGNGGDGGNAGKGGPGGNGGLSSNIFINVPPTQASLIKRTALPGKGGSGGIGGRGGKPGLPGHPGIKPVPGLMGDTGQKGLDGINGNSGRSRPAASMYLNEVL